MKTILIAEEITIKRQEGDTASIEIEVPAIISMEGKHIHFAVMKGSEVIFSKVKDGEKDEWEVDGQTITAEMEEEDTRGWAGRWRHELQVWDNEVAYTIMRGDFIIVRELITENRHDD